MGWARKKVSLIIIAITLSAADQLQCWWVKGKTEN